MRVMRASRRRSAVAWTGLLLVSAATAIPASSATAAATLEPRPTPAAAPTDRVLEQVSPVDKGGNPIRHVWRVADSEDGGVLFSSWGPFGDAQGGTTNSTFFRARRGARGWQTLALQPRPIDDVAAVGNSPYQWFDGTDSQLESLVFHTYFAYVPEAARPPGVLRTHVYRAGPHGAVSWLSSDSGALENALVNEVSPDGQRVLLNARSTLYVRDGERTVPVGVDPDGATLPSSAGVSVPTTAYPIRQMSDDGQTVAFFGPEGLYVRRDALRPNASTVIASPSGSLVGMSADGARLWLAAGEPLADGAPASGGLYEYRVATDDLRYLGPGASHGLGADRELRRGYAASDSGDLWLTDDRGSRMVVPDALSTPGTARSSMSRNGERLAFISDRGLDGGYAGPQMYVYDATDGPDGSLTCVSCRAGASSGGEAFFGTGDIPEPIEKRFGAMSDSFTADGSSFFFMSTAALTPGAPEGPASVYEYRDGKVRLLVAGSAQGDARFAGASPGGTDVFVLTRQSLLPQDDDAPVQDLYSFRRGGGFPPDPVCAGCEPPAPSDQGGPVPEGPIHSQQDAPLSVGERSPVLAPTPKPKVVSRRAKGTAVVVRVRARVAGTLRITGNGLQRTTRKASRAGTYAVTVRLTSKARRAVARRGRLSVRLRVRLTPKSGVVSSATTTLTIKRTTRKAG